MIKNWYGFDHKKVREKFEGNVIYLNDLCVNDEYDPVAVYKSLNPNRKKHREYLLLQRGPTGRLLIRGMDQEEMDKWRFQDGVKCNLCQDVIYSVNRYDFRSCKCGSVSIDGGKCYTKLSWEKNNNFTCVTVDLLLNLYI